MKKTIHNPVLKGFNPDPSICRVGDDYYIAVSTFEWFPGVQIHHSKDLVNWRLVSNPLQRVSQLDMKGNPDSGGVWAPALTYADGQFWLIYSDVKVTGGAWKDVTNYLVTCTTIDGEWSEPIYMNGSGFDPSLFHDTDGRKWFVNMVWDQRSYNHSFYGIVLQEYDYKNRKLTGDKKVIFKGTELGLVEAPHIFKVKDYYYLITAEGGTKFEHAVTLARSKNVDGPYELHPQNPILTSWTYPLIPLQKAGHASMVETQNGEWYLAHLMGRPTRLPGVPITQSRGFCQLGRETSIQKLYWEDDWPYVVGGNKPSVEVEAPDLPEVKWPADYPTVDDFDEPKLNHHFNTLRIPFDKNLGCLTSRPGHLRLYGRQSFHSLFEQSLVARRWQSFTFTAETKLEFNPTSFQQQAGLVCYYNTKNWTSVHLTLSEKKGKVIDIMTCDRQRVSYPLGSDGQIPVPADVAAVYFRVDVEQMHYTFSYSFDGKTFTQIPQKFDSYKLSDDYIEESGFFTGAFVGMHCIDTSGDRGAADFDYFKYEEKS
ncbi:MAG: glycoside hydrolase family 43 protein [Defluviitaleaceae bacterium]|nr:glycoside hydrolase family 43 protein [Defluviitaleaceae bacterium]